MIGQILLAASGGLAMLGMHPFTTYPLSLRALARVRPRPAALLDDSAATAPRVALCVCAYNEERVIRAKADNMLAMRDAFPGLELRIYVDAASDRTAEILREYAGRIDVTISPARLGKTHGMNTLVGSTGAEIIVFSDANVVFAPDAIPRLLARFAEPDVGCVCGHLIYVTKAASATAVTGSLYWRLEEAIKQLESQTGSIMGADGSIFAIRRTLHRPPPPDIIDDMFVSLSILCDGHRIVRAADAIAYEEAATNSSDEFRRKVRISCQAYNVHRLLRSRLARLPALDRYKYVSHKLLRWFSIYFLAGAGAAFIAGLAALHAWSALITVVTLGIAGLVGALLAPNSPFGKILDSLAAFVATGFGVIRSLRGERFQVWTPPASARAGH